jgi:tRNA A37 threonylcarbamoyladenosine synthetase subunit TsaC/SUA5/YrdC
MGWARMRWIQAAVASIFAAKKRPAWDPVIVHML